MCFKALPRSSVYVVLCRDFATMRGGLLSRTLSTVPDVANESYMGGIPRRIVLTSVGAISKLYGTILNSTQVHNESTLLSLVKSRPSHTPLLTVSNHVSTLDDPLMWGFRGFPLTDSKLTRWTLAAKDICFTNRFFSYFFRLGKCIPITRGAGIYQPQMSEALDRLNDGDWLHTFPEGKISQEFGPLRRLKWGTASLIARARVSPIVLPIAHNGFEKVMPENFWNGCRPPIPLWNKKVTIFIGEPMQFDIPGLKQLASDWARKAAAHDNHPGDRPEGMPSAFSSALYNPDPLPLGVRRCSSLLHVAETLHDSHSSGLEVSGPLLDEAAWRWMYTHITEHIWVALNDVTQKARMLGNLQNDS